MAATTLDNGPIDSKYKILLVGDSDVGKTDILNKYIEEGAPGCIDYKTHTIEHDSKRIQLQIWDTQGQERFRAITSSYYRGAHGAMIVFDVINRDSYEHIEDWFKDIERYCEPNVSKILVGHLDTKPDKAREVLEDEVKDFASNNGISYIEVSAKTGKNVEDAFLTLAKEVYVTQSRIQDEPETYVPIVPQASSSSIRGSKKNGKCCR